MAMFIAPLGFFCFYSVSTSMLTQIYEEVAYKHKIRKLHRKIKIT